MDQAPTLDQSVTRGSRLLALSGVVGVIFGIVALGFVVSTFIATPGPAAIGSLLILSGVPVYFWWKRA